ncbi:Uncharacterised protein [Legionella sainthelensi]|nr:Uncharacterised protein [Legionella sainthelensi]
MVNYGLASEQMASSILASGNQGRLIAGSE